MSLANCFESLNKGKPIFDADEMKEIRALANRNTGKMSVAEAEKAAVQTMLDEALAEQEMVVELVREGMGLPPVPKAKAAKMDEAVKTPPSPISENQQKVKEPAQEAKADSFHEQGYYPQVDIQQEQAQYNAEDNYEIPTEIINVLPVARADLTALRREAAGIEKPERGITLQVTEDGKAIATGPKGSKVPDSFRQFATDNNLTFVVQRRPAFAGESSTTYSDGKIGYTAKAESTAEKPMPIEYRESGALYFGEMGEHVKSKGTALFSRDTDLDHQVHPLQDKYDVSRETARQMYEAGDRIDEKGDKYAVMYSRNAQENIPADIEAKMIEAYNADLPSQEEQLRDAKKNNYWPDGWEYSTETISNLEETYGDDRADWPKNLVAALGDGNEVVTIGRGGDYEYFAPKDAPPESEFNDEVASEIGAKYPATSLDEMLDESRINGFVGESATSEAFKAMAKAEGWSADERGTRYFDIRKDNPDPKTKEDNPTITLHVRVSDHSKTAGFSRPDSAKDIHINIAPSDGRDNEYYGADTFESALWTMRNASLDEDGNVLVAGQEPSLFSKGQATVNPHSVESLKPALIEAHTGKDKLALSAMFEAGKAKVITAEQAGGIVGDKLFASVDGYNVDQSLLDELGAVHKDVDAFLSIKGDVITLSELQMPKEIRGEGIGSRFMEILISYADANRMKIALTAAGDFGGSRSGQERFYKRFGFVSNKGSNKDFRISENMIRRPIEVKYSKDGRATAFYNPSDATTYFIADNLSADTSAADLKGLVRHEIAVHALNLGKSSKEFRSILKEVDLIRLVGNKAVIAAHGRALQALGLSGSSMNGTVQSISRNSYSDSDVLAAKTGINKLLDKIEVILGFGREGNIEAVSDKNANNTLGGAPENLPDLLIRHPSITKRLSTLDIEAQKIVLSSVRRSIHDNEVFNSIVQFIPVDMMAAFARGELTSNTALHNMAVFENLSPINSNKPVSVFMDAAGRISAIINTAAATRAKYISSFGPDALAGAANKFGTASGTIQNRHDVTPLSDVVLGGAAGETVVLPPIVSKETLLHEQLAYLVQHHPSLGIVKKFIAWFREQLRAIGKAFPAMQRMKWNAWADSLQVEDLVYMASTAMSRAYTASQAQAGDYRDSLFTPSLDRSGAPLFSNTNQTDTPAFKAWFGSSGFGTIFTGQPSMSEGRPNSDTSNAESISDLLKSETFRLKGLGGLDVPSQRKVLNGVVALADDIKIFRAIINLIPVNVMDIFSRQKLSAEKVLSDKPMLKNYLSADSKGSISTAVDIANALVSAVTSVAAKYSGSSTTVTSRGSKANSTSGANIIDGLHGDIVNQGAGIGNRGTLDQNNPNILFSRESTPKPKTASQSPIPGTAQTPAQPPRQNNLGLSNGQAGSRASWDSPEPSMFDDLVYKMQDKHIDMKRVIEAIKSAGVLLAEKWNPYLQEELFHNRASKRTQDFVNTELKPMTAEMRARGLTMPELDEYLHARHAKEANALIAQRDPNMPDGGSGMTNQQADDYFSILPADKRKKLEATAKRVDAMIARTREYYVSYGLVSKDTADEWAAMFKHYVPLMREDHDGGMGIGQGFSIKGKEVKHRTGSTAAVVDIFANIAMQREKAIVRGEKNRVAVSLFGLVYLNPNPDFWTADTIPAERVLNEKTGLVETRADPMFKSRNNVVVAKIKGKSGDIHERAVIFNEHDERAVRMAEAIKNLDATQLGGLLGVSAVITRYFASINTQYNLVFGVTNLVRDVQGAALNLSSTPLAKHKAEVMKHILSAAKGIYLDARAERKGNPAASKWAQLWEELQNEGGMTGYRDLYRNSADRAKAIEHELDPHNWVNSKWGKVFTANGMLKVPLTTAQDVASPLFDWLSDYNLMMEGCTRLAIYKTAIDHGLSKQAAASLAKNTTVNFNRKGQSGQQVGALYAFFNAAMQGTARIGETVFDMQKGDIKTLRLSGTGKKIVAGGILLGAMQALALAFAGFDDDEPPEFIRERNLVIPIGGKKYVSIPMPLGFHALPNIGRITTEYAMGGFKRPVDHVVRLLSVFAEAFNPIGSSGFSTQTILPTALDPLGALSENKDWTGKPIYKEDFNSLAPTPGFTRNKDTASAWSKFFAEGINYATGGTDYTPGTFSPTADQIDYLIGQVTGGVGRELSKGAQTGAALYTGEELPTHKIPLVGRFYGNSDNQSSQGNRYYSNLKEINLLEAEWEGRKKDGLPTEDFEKENPEYELIGRANGTENLISKLRRRKAMLVKDGASREDLREVDDRITEAMRNLNDDVRKSRATAAP